MRGWGDRCLWEGHCLCPSGAQGPWAGLRNGQFGLSGICLVCIFLKLRLFHLALVVRKSLLRCSIVCLLLLDLLENLFGDTAWLWGPDALPPALAMQPPWVLLLVTWALHLLCFGVLVSVAVAIHPRCNPSPPHRVTSFQGPRVKDRNWRALSFWSWWPYACGLQPQCGPRVWRVSGGPTSLPMSNLRPSFPSHRIQLTPLSWKEAFANHLNVGFLLPWPWPWT